MWLLDRLCAVCDGIGDGDFLGGCGGRCLDGIIWLPYLLVVTGNLTNRSCVMIYQ